MHKLNARHNYLCRNADSAAQNTTADDFDAADGFPSVLWKLLEADDSDNNFTLTRPITGVLSNVSCVDTPVRVWFNDSDMIFTGGAVSGYFDVEG